MNIAPSTVQLYMREPEKVPRRFYEKIFALTPQREKGKNDWVLQKQIALHIWQSRIATHTNWEREALSLAMDEADARREAQ